MSGRADVEMRAPDRQEGPEPAAAPPLLQTTRGAQMAPNGDARIAPNMQPACKVAKNRAEQSQRRIPSMHAGEEVGEHQSLQDAGAGIGTRHMLGGSLM
jgi:hypothetical protein